MPEAHPVFTLILVTSLQFSAVCAQMRRILWFYEIRKTFLEQQSDSINPAQCWKKGGHS